ncbi:hypothetical protein F5884DRAFT_794994 [Xylogone sp. PMI_703]|nr:hypothetical protein F5884DRAFT_794994 [Xylogone sp. PMI_703]
MKSFLVLFAALGALAAPNPLASVNSFPVIEKVDPAELAALRNSTGSLEKRTVGGVYFCSDAGFEGNCGYAVQPLNTCIPITV